MQPFQFTQVLYHYKPTLMKFALLATALTLGTISVQAQENTAPKLKVYVDCASTFCDYTYIRTEINLVDFFLDRLAADVHVLITSRQAGSGGTQYQVIFFGQKRFINNRDTLTIQTGANATDFERRDLMVHYLKLGLAPFIAIPFRDLLDLRRDIFLSGEVVRPERFNR